MKIHHNILLALGILMTAGAVAGVGLFYRDMKTENLLHATTGSMPFGLSEGGDWKSAKFALYSPGVHTVCLSLTEANRVFDPLPPYAGELELDIQSPDGKSYYQKNIPGAAFPGKNDTTEWFYLATFDVREPTEKSWTMRARVTKGDAGFPKINGALFILPPQRLDIANYLSDNIYKLLLMGVMVLAGFVLIVYGGRQRREAAEEYEPKRW